MKLFTVWHNTTGLDEKCLMTETGDYVGVNTGNLYKKEKGHYHSKQHTGIIRNLSIKQELIDERTKLDKYVGCYVTLEEAHLYDGTLVYRCRELNQYLTSDEVEILTKQQLRQWKMEKILKNE